MGSPQPKRRGRGGRAAAVPAVGVTARVGCDGACAALQAASDRAASEEPGEQGARRTASAPRHLLAPSSRSGRPTRGHFTGTGRPARLAATRSGDRGRIVGVTVPALAAALDLAPHPRAAGTAAPGPPMVTVETPHGPRPSATADPLPARRRLPPAPRALGRAVVPALAARRSTLRTSASPRRPATELTCWTPTTRSSWCPPARGRPPACSAPSPALVTCVVSPGFDFADFELCRPRRPQRVAGQQALHRPRVEDALGRHAAFRRPGAAVVEPVELPGRVRVGVDREQAAGLDGQAQQPLRRVEPLRPGVDLHRDPVLGARREHRVGVELRLRPLLRLPVTMRPVQWPSTSTCGFATAVSIRSVISAAGIRSLLCTLATTTSSSASRSGSWSRPPSSRMSTSMPVSTRNPVSTSAR